MLLSSIVILLRLTYLKAYTKDDYYERALNLWTRSAPVEGRRGNIYDRNGKLIVGSELAPSIVVIPKQIKNIEYLIKYGGEPEIEIIMKGDKKFFILIFCCKFAQFNVYLRTILWKPCC